MLCLESSEAKQIAQVFTDLNALFRIVKSESVSSKSTECVRRWNFRRDGQTKNPHFERSLKGSDDGAL
jgi:hypothetical protein